MHLYSLQPSNIILKAQRRKVYCIYPYFCLLCSFFLSDISRFLLLSFAFCWRTSSRHSFRVGLILASSLFFFLLRMCWFLLKFLRDIFPRYRILGCQLLSSNDWKRFRFPSSLHGFWWKIHCHSHWFYSIGKVSFFSCCFHIFSLVFSVQRFDYDVSCCGFLMVHSVSGLPHWTSIDTKSTENV